MPKRPTTKFILLVLMLTLLVGRTYSQSDTTKTSDTLVLQADSMVLDSAAHISDTSSSLAPNPIPEEWHGAEPYGRTLESLSLRMITGQTTKVLKKGVLEFCVQHRFGYFSQGKSQFYGLDLSDVRLGFDYGLTRRITLGIGRSSLGKAFNGYIKAAIAKQGDHSYCNFTWVSDMYVSGLRNTDPNLEPYYFTHRLKYLNQLLISRTFADRIMLTVAPTVIHNNLVDSAKYPNDLSLLVVNARLKVRKGMNLTAEYAYLFNHDMRKLYYPCIGGGLELYTSGHIFQIVLSNSNSMNEAAAYAMKNGRINKGDFRLGFNIVRQF